MVIGISREGAPDNLSRVSFKRVGPILEYYFGFFFHFIFLFFILFLGVIFCYLYLTLWEVFRMFFYSIIDLGWKL